MEIAKDGGGVKNRMHLVYYAKYYNVAVRFRVARQSIKRPNPSDYV